MDTDLKKQLARKDVFKQLNNIQTVLNFILHRKLFFKIRGNINKGSMKINIYAQIETQNKWKKGTWKKTENKVGNNLINICILKVSFLKQEVI